MHSKTNEEMREWRRLVDHRMLSCIGCSQVSDAHVLRQRRTCIGYSCVSHANASINVRFTILTAYRNAHILLYPKVARRRARAGPEIQRDREEMDSVRLGYQFGRGLRSIRGWEGTGYSRDHGRNRFGSATDAHKQSFLLDKASKHRRDSSKPTPP
jgi:hypothetical protein